MTKLLIAIPISSESNALISWAVDYWRGVNLPHHFSIDSKFENQVVPLLNDLGVKNYSIFYNPGLTIESNYQNFCFSIPSDAILRIDLDEILTSPKIFKRTDQILSQNPSANIGIPRSQLISRSGRLHICSSREFDPVLHTQWRGFNKHLVDWDSRVHTAGFEVSEKNKFLIHSSRSFFHLNWLFLDQAQLLEKSDRYDLAGQIGANREQHTFKIAEAKSRIWLNLNQARKLTESLDKHGFKNEN